MLWNFILGLYIILGQQIQPNSRTELYLNELFEDALESYDYKVYSLALPNKEMIMNKTLIITLIPYVGNPKLAVDCDEKPKLMDYYEWQAPKYFMQQLSITAKEREALNCSGQLFYIGVSTEVPTGYIINSYILSGQLALYFNIPVSGELVTNEVINYQINPEGVSNEITIQIIADKSVITYLKQCNTTLCNVTSEDMKQNTDTGILIQQPQFTFIHSEEDCKQCHYILALYSVKKAQYRILTKHNETHTLLREGITDQSYVYEGFYNYYAFQIPNDTSIRYVKFQLTTYTGNVTMYSSDDVQEPNDQAYQQTSSSAIVMSRISNSTIYLSIYGNEYSYYGLYTSVSRTDELTDQNFIILENGVPQQFDQDTEFSFFQIQLDQTQNISINLIPLKGDLMMFIKSSNSINLEIPDSNSYQWKSDRQITINTDDPNYSMIYYIGVEKYNTDSAQFSIQFSLKGDIFQYKIGEQIIGTTENNSLNYYKISMVAEDLIITKEVYSHTDINELQVYISVNQSNTHPSSQNYDYILNGKSITIPNSKLLCNKQQQQQQIQQPTTPTKINERTSCFVYFSVGSQNVNFYSISTKSNNSLVQLFEGLPQTFPMVKTIFYYILQDQEVNVQCYNSEGQYFRLHGWFGTLDKQFKDFTPSNNNFYFQSLTIPSNTNESRIYFSVTPQYENSNFTFTIGVYEELIFLTESDPVVDYLYGGVFKYYRINVIQADSILIQVSQVGAGFFRIVASKGIDSRPDFNQADHTTFLDSNHIIIEKDQELLNGDYIVGVFAYKDTEIQIAYTSGQFKLFNMYFATPFNIYLPPNEPYYYIIKSQLALKIIVANLAGDLNIKIKQYNGDNYKEAIESNNTLISQSIERQAVLYIEKCGENCSYLIELISREDNTHAVLEVIGDNEVITLHNSMMWRDILQEDEVGMFKLGSYGKQQLFITLISGEIRVLIKEGSYIDHDDEATTNTRVKEDMTIDIPENSSYFHYNYIKVIGISETSVYTIMPSLKDYLSTEIYYGQTRAGTLQPNESIFYHFRSFVQVEDKYVILTVITKNTSLDNLYLDVFHSEIEPISSIDTFKRAAVIRMYDQQGVYQIELRANELPMHYQLSLIDDKTNVLIDDVPFYNAASINEYQIYQIFVEEKSQILLEAYSCQGTILIQGTKSLENLQQQIFEIQLTQGSQTHIQEIIKCDTGIYYFMVEIISTGKLNQTAYYIKQQSFEHTDIIPQNVFKQSGNLYWDINVNQLRLQIPNFISVNPLISFKEVTYIFRLDATMEDETLQCIFDENYLSGNNTQQDDPYTYIFLQDNSREYTEILIDLVDDKFVYLSGMAKVLIVNNDNEIEELTYPLDRVHLDYIKKTTNKSFNWWNCIVISFFILFLIVMSVLLYKKTQMPITTEQQDNAQIELNYQNFS